MLKALLHSAGCFVLLSACAEHLATKPMATEPEPVFRLSPEQLASLRPGVSADALERMLTRIPPAHRTEFLRYFRNDVHAGIVETDNTELQPLLSELWAPDRDRRSVVETAEPPPSGLSTGFRLVLSPKLDEPGTGALILRSPGESQDVIVLGEEFATPSQLFRAVGVLMDNRLTKGNPMAPVRIAVEPVRIPDGVQGAEAARMAERLYGPYVEQLLKSHPETLPAFGRVRTLQLTSFGQQVAP